MKSATSTAFVTGETSDCMAAAGRAGHPGARPAPPRGPRPPTARPPEPEPEPRPAATLRDKRGLRLGRVFPCQSAPGGGPSGVRGVASVGGASAAGWDR